jgi:SNF2-related domain
VIIDEAHRLRNVYKPANRIANSIKEALAPFHKVLLTATPLQNSLLELYGLVSIIDDHTFGDLKSFKTQFANLRNPEDFSQLKDRLRPICQRTLRRQVFEYVPYTNRKAIVQEFFPSADEQKLYDLVSDYLQRPNLFALPSGQRQLMTLILRKLLASSTYAISGTLEALSSKLEAIPKAQAPVELNPSEVASDYEAVDETEEEWGDDGDSSTEAKRYTGEELEQPRRRSQDSQGFRSACPLDHQELQGRGSTHGLEEGLCCRHGKGSPEESHHLH